MFGRYAGAFILVGVLLATPSTGRSAPLSPEQLDARIRQSAVLAIKAGVPVYNKGEYESCFRIYQGALIALEPLLDHRPALQESIRKALARGNAETVVSRRAYALRPALDDILNAIPKPTDKPLWDRLGGEKAVRAVVADFVKRAASDPKVNFDRGGKFKFDSAAVEMLQQRLVELVSMVGGGPLKYTGRDMKSSHAGMKITNAEFDALAGHLVAVLNAYKVPAAEQKELLGAIASTRKDIVEVADQPAGKSLYERLGGARAIHAVVEDFVGRAARNPKVNFTRKGTSVEWSATPENVALLKKHLVQFVSLATGGPKKYEGRDMKAAHKGMEITDAEFDALAADLKATLDKFKVPAREQKELLTIVGSTRKDIVEKK